MTTNLQETFRSMPATRFYRSLPKALAEPERVRWLSLLAGNRRALKADLGVFTNLERLAILKVGPAFDLDGLVRSLARCTSLRELAIHDGVGLCIPPSIGLLRSLHRLECWGGVLENVADEVFTLPELREFMVLGHTLTRLPPAVVRCTSLLHLYFARGPLEELPDELASMTQLLGLYLHTNQLRRIPDSLRALRNLAFVELERNPLEAIPPWLATLPLSFLRAPEEHSEALVAEAKARGVTCLELHRADGTSYRPLAPPGS